MTRKRRSAEKCRVVREDGPPCPRCSRATQVCEHVEVTAKHLRQPYFFACWYRCRHGDCKTTLIMPDEFRVLQSQRIGIV
jgi:hypothetical protein